MPNIALLIWGIGDLSGGGGSERFFADFYDQYQKYSNKKFKLYYIIDKDSVENLNKVEKLKSKKNILSFKLISNRFKSKGELLQLMVLIIRHKIRIIHLPLYNVSYIPILKGINSLPGFIRPKIVINVSNCYIVPYLEDKQSKHHLETVNTYSPLFNEVKVNGYFSWYKNFENYILSSNYAKRPDHVYSISSRFSDTEKFYPEQKENLVVFAARLDEQKHPEWFLEAVRIIFSSGADSVCNWKFMICGDGPLREQLIRKSKEYNLNEQLIFTIEGQLHKILNKSKVFVSCQDFENFPSLSMAEAMASGNAIIARNVGQTSYFVEENQNGFYIIPDSPQGLANSLLKAIAHGEQLENMMADSVNKMKTRHTFLNFTNQIEQFWQTILN